LFNNLALNRSKICIYSPNLHVFGNHLNIVPWCHLHKFWIFSNNCYQHLVNLANACLRNVNAQGCDQEWLLKECWCVGKTHHRWVCPTKMASQLEGKRSR
jgi:hypothetical protein